MDPGNGTLYASYDAALLAGVTNPVELTGALEDVQRISEAVKSASGSRRTHVT